MCKSHPSYVGVTPIELLPVQILLVYCLNSIDSGMERLSKILRRALIGTMFFVGVLNLFQYVVSLFREELFSGADTLPFLIMGIILTVGAIILFKVKVTYKPK